MGGFISEFLVVAGSWPIITLWTALSMIGLFFTGAYILKALKLVLHGPTNEQWRGKLKDMSRREILITISLIVLVLLVGLWPNWLLGVVNQTIAFLF